MYGLLADGLTLSVSEITGIASVLIIVIGGLMGWLAKISSTNSTIKKESESTTSQVTEVKNDVNVIKSDINEIKVALAGMAAESKHESKSHIAFNAMFSKLFDQNTELRDRVARLEEFRKRMEG